VIILRAEAMRRFASRYEKKAANFAGFIWLPVILVGQVT
jgi:hypothetical protein